jgi:hypothetical protein
VDLAGVRLTGGGRLVTITGPDPQAYNEPGGRTDITTTERPLRRFPARLDLPALSINLFRVAAEPTRNGSTPENGGR